MGRSDALALGRSVTLTKKNRDIDEIYEVNQNYWKESLVGLIKSFVVG